MTFFVLASNWICFWCGFSESSNAPESNGTRRVKCSTWIAWSRSHIQRLRLKGHNYIIIIVTRRGLWLIELIQAFVPLNLNGSFSLVEFLSLSLSFSLYCIVRARVFCVFWSGHLVCWCAACVQTESNFVPPQSTRRTNESRLPFVVMSAQNLMDRKKR